MEAATKSQAQTKISLAGKVIAITGANRGIGLGIADCCLSNDAHAVYSIDVGETGDEWEAVSKRYPGKLHALKADVTKEETVKAAIDQIMREAGGLHGMVVNAGRTKHKAALDFTTEEIDQLWSINVSNTGKVPTAPYTNKIAAVRFILLRTSRCTGFHQAGRERFGGVHSQHGILQAE